MIKLEVKPQPGKGPGINIHGPHVTEAVHQVFSVIMGSNRTDCKFYKARSKCTAFFQGGFDRPKDNWVFIEFWGANYLDFVQLLREHMNYLDNDGNPLPIRYTCPAEAKQREEDFFNFYESWENRKIIDSDISEFTPSSGFELMAFLQHAKELSYIIHRTEILVGPYAWEEKGSLGVFQMVTEDTSVPYIWLLGEDLRFLPTNEEQKLAVMDLLAAFKIPYVLKKFDNQSQ